MRNRCPDFFIVGAPKCGTTAVYTWLKEHERIHMPRKEPGFFSRDIADNTHVPGHIRTLKEYIEIIGVPKSSPHKAGEATPKYLFSDYALSEISRIRPDAKIIVCLRDPVELVISLHNQKIREGVECERSFERAWLRSLAAVGKRDVKVAHELHYYLWACLGSRLKVLYQHFPRTSVLVLLTDELRSDPRACYQRVLDFIGVQDDGRDQFGVHNERVAIRSLTVHRAVLGVKKAMGPILQPLYQINGGKAVGVMTLVNRFNVVKGQYTTDVSAGFQRKMYEKLHEEIAMAEGYLEGRKLVHRDKV